MLAVEHVFQHLLHDALPHGVMGLTGEVLCSPGESI